MSGKGIYFFRAENDFKKMNLKDSGLSPTDKKTSMHACMHERWFLCGWMPPWHVKGHA